MLPFLLSKPHFERIKIVLFFGMPFLTCFPYAAQKSERAARVVIKNAKHSMLRSFAFLITTFNHHCH
jgi:hypothetical protein